MLVIFSTYTLTYCTTVFAAITGILLFIPSHMVWNPSICWIFWHSDTVWLMNVFSWTACSAFDSRIFGLLLHYYLTTNNVCNIIYSCCCICCSIWSELLAFQTNGSIFRYTIAVLLKYYKLYSRISWSINGDIIGHSFGHMFLYIVWQHYW